jgi:beta-phosphoglucomutase-like phosphatase (HAD superfamily)
MPESKTFDSKLPEIRGLVFDCDGTIADTMPLHWKAWQSVTARYGFVFPEERFYALGGVPSREIFALLCAEHGRPDLDCVALAKEKEAAYMPFMPEVRRIELVVDIALQNHGVLPMAVASGGLKDVIQQVLEQLGIRHLFSAVVTSEDVVHNKPAPDIFLEAARRIGVAPEHCRAYEDTELGLQAIRAAGMQAVDVRELLGAPPAAGGSRH